MNTKRSTRQPSPLACEPLEPRRLLTNIVPDLLFGFEGSREVPINGSFSGDVADVERLSDGSFIGSGYTGSPTAVPSIAKFNVDGSFDTSFGQGGALVNSIAGFAGDIEVTADGTVYTLAGIQSNLPGRVASFLSDGSVNTAFGQNGLVDLSVFGSDFRSMNLTLDGSGGVYVVGGVIPFNARQGAVGHLLADGSPDAAFGNGGLWVDAQSDRFSRGDLDSQGRLVVGGRVDIFSPEGQVVVKVDQAGVPVPDFGTDGRFSREQDVFDVDALRVMPDDSVLVGSNTSVLKLTPAGARDVSFGTEGEITLGVISGVVGDIDVYDNGDLFITGSTDFNIVVEHHASDGTLLNAQGVAASVSTNSTTTFVDELGRLTVASGTRDGIRPWELSRYRVINDPGGTVRISNGTIAITGTAAADVLDIHDAGDDWSFEFNGTSYTFAASEADQLLAWLEAGDDGVTVAESSSASPKPVKLDLSDGADTATMGRPAEILMGGAGDDRLRLPARSDPTTLVDQIFFGQDGEDEVHFIGSELGDNYFVGSVDPYADPDECGCPNETEFIEGTGQRFTFEDHLSPLKRAEVLRIFGNGGNDAVIHDSIGGPTLLFEAGAGDDTLELRRGYARFDAGDGDDLVFGNGGGSTDFLAGDGLDRVRLSNPDGDDLFQISANQVFGNGTLIRFDDPFNLAADAAVTIDSSVGVDEIERTFSDIFDPVLDVSFAADGDDVLHLIDARSIASIVTVDGAAVTLSGFGQFATAGYEVLHVTGKDADTDFVVQRFGDLSRVQISAGGGQDDIRVRPQPETSTQPVTIEIDGESGSDQVFITPTNRLTYQITGGVSGFDTLHVLDLAPGEIDVYRFGDDAGVLKFDAFDDIAFTNFESYDSVLDLSPPRSLLDFRVDPWQGLQFYFHIDIRDYLTPGNFLFENLTTGEVIDSENLRVIFSTTGRLAAVYYDDGEGGRTMPDGNYRATLVGETLDIGGNPLNGNVIEHFFVLAGDANRDRTVDLADFVILRNNYGTGTTFSRGDFNHDNVVDLADFIILRNNFGVELPPIGGDDEESLF